MSKTLRKLSRTQYNSSISARSVCICVGERGLFFSRCQSSALLCCRCWSNVARGCACNEHHKHTTHQSAESIITGEQPRAALALLLSAATCFRYTLALFSFIKTSRCSLLASLVNNRAASKRRQQCNATAPLISSHQCQRTRSF